VLVMRVLFDHVLSLRIKYNIVSEVTEEFVQIKLSLKWVSDMEKSMKNDLRPNRGLFYCDTIRKLVDVKHMPSKV
jgi:hypothetical protein